MIPKPRTLWWEVAKREVADNLVSWKLPVAGLLVVVLLVTGVVSLSAAYDEQWSAWNLVQDEYAGKNQTDSDPALAHRILAHPNPLSLLVGGPAEDVRDAFATPPSVANGTVTPRANPLLLRFATLDLGTVGVGVLTLLAVLVSYDAVAGEKERGTLKVLLVNPLSRAELLLGKYAGAMLTLLAPLAVGVLVAFLALLLAGIRFGPGDATRLLLVLAFLALLLSAFVLTGLLVSSLTARSPVAIVALLFAWLVLVAGAGSLATFAASVDSDARDLDDVLVELNVLDASYGERDADLASEISGLEREKAASGGVLSPDRQARLDAAKAERAALPAERAEEARRLVESFLRSREIDLARAERFAAVSPAESFRTVAQAAARTDYASVRQEIDEFEAYLREAEAARAAGDELPAYRSAPASVGRDVARVAPFVGLLVAENALLGIGAAAAFRRYDAR